MPTDLSTGPTGAGASSGVTGGATEAGVPPTVTEVTFPVTGMTCASCVRRIEKRLGKVEGVDQVSVNLATEKARVVYDPGVVTFSDLTSAVEKAGYGVGEMDEPVDLTPQPPLPRTAGPLGYAVSP